MGSSCVQLSLTHTHAHRVLGVVSLVCELKAVCISNSLHEVYCLLLPLEEPEFSL